MNSYFEVIVAAAPVPNMRVLGWLRLANTRLRFALERNPFFKLIPTLNRIRWNVGGWLATHFGWSVWIQILVHDHYYLFSNYWILQWRLLAASGCTTRQSLRGGSFICLVLVALSVLLLVHNLFLRTFQLHWDLFLFLFGFSYYFGWCLLINRSHIMLDLYAAVWVLFWWRVTKVLVYQNFTVTAQT